MNKVHRNKQPKDGGEQIILNSDRITFNSKNEILGFSKPTLVGLPSGHSRLIDKQSGTNQIFRKKNFNDYRYKLTKRGHRR